MKFRTVPFDTRDDLSRIKIDSIKVLKGEHPLFRLSKTNRKNISVLISPYLKYLFKFSFSSSSSSFITMEILATKGKTIEDVQKLLEKKKFFKPSLMLNKYKKTNKLSL